MSKPVNLNQFRKDRARDEKKARADRNAVTFGRTKQERQAEEQKAARAEKHLDGHKREE
ncbi:MAG: DUF4169 family protein [Sulfitobacter sp.]|nr:DUF4169 family protein [Sulfitobacter sp.]